ncbi:MAG TPA: aminotransferase class III-fold pyridoxal phosphate-dependent enzyme [Steroidobacteraceae bacterium]|nr:aminotransferase class III-fold pyridoxal phosphate-dependent enzyme [Steroidobacteraceae bacterium]HRX88924.1 aminotransferase class III-fold pyridoxal phosphate-dependent enzyme [Steroidobacteraceae bacterium]
MEITSETLEHHWLPFTDNRGFKREPRLFVRAEGMYYWNHRGERILDGSSGLFTSAAGHCRPEIAKAVGEQLQTLDFTASFMRGHPASFELANQVAELTPQGLDHIFFCNSGSEAIDTAIKIAFAYHLARNEAQRTYLVSRERAYHGVNIGGTALSGMVRNREAFGSLLPGVLHLRHTLLPANRCKPGMGDVGADLAEDLQRLVQLVGEKRIAAVFVEPIAGSTGVIVPPRGYLQRIREICTRYGILLVFDEVICGFGRTGEAFAAQSFGVAPDIMTMAKALTNGAQPMGAVAVHETIYQEVVNRSPQNVPEFFHGYTYSAHPAACAAGLATLEIYRKEQLFEKARALSDYFQAAMFALQDLPIIADVRGYGMLAGIEVKPGKAPGARGTELQGKLFDRGLHIKTTADVAIIAPPFIATRADIDTIAGMLRDALREY